MSSIDCIVFHIVDETGNNANIEALLCEDKNSSNKMLPPVSIEPVLNFSSLLRDDPNIPKFSNRLRTFTT